MQSSHSVKNTSYYSIKDLEKLTGIKAHTIRIWEKRYNVIEPDRTDTNIRKYSDADLKKILLISILNENGHKISKIAHLHLSELNKMVRTLSGKTSEMSLFIDQLVVSMIEMDEQSFSQQIDDLTQWFGFEKAVMDIVFPFCEKIGILWLIEKIHPAHEHFISNMIRQKLMVNIDALPSPSGESKKVVLFLKEGEYHDIGLLFYYYLFKKAGLKTIFLGQATPMEDVARVVEFHKADILVSALITKISPEQTQNWIDELAENFPDQRIILSGQHLNEVDVHYPDNITHYSTARQIWENI